MGKAGRFVCIFTPLVLTIASLICLVLVFVGNTSNNGVASSIYFFKADTTDATLANDTRIADAVSSATGINVPAGATSALDTLLAGARQTGTLKDFYTIGLWNYCSGDKAADGTETVTFCSEKQSMYWFNPVEVWGLQNTGLQQAFPEELQQGLETYRTVAKWMWIAYVVAIAATCVELVVALTAICSRWGSFLTTVVSAVSTVFVVGASATASVLYATLAGAFNEALRDYQIRGEVGRRMMTITWLAAVFSLVAGLFWLLSVCCCSGRSSSPAHRGETDASTTGGFFGRKKKGSTRYTESKGSYDRVPSPYMGATDGEVPMQPYTQQSYGQMKHEPFRRADERV